MDWINSMVSSAVAGVPLLFPVLALVYGLRRLGLSGRALFIASLGMGIMLGGGYMVSQSRPPVGDAWTIYVYWFSVAFYGLAIGAVASLAYDLSKDLLLRVLEKITAGILGKITPPTDGQ